MRKLNKIILIILIGACFCLKNSVSSVNYKNIDQKRVKEKLPVFDTKIFIQYNFDCTLKGKATS